MTEQPLRRAADHGFRGWLYRNIGTLVVAYLVVIATITGIALAIVAINEAEQTERNARLVRQAQINSCERINEVRANQRWKFRQDARLYELIASVAASPRASVLLRDAAAEMRARLERLEDVRCARTIPLLTE